MSTTPDSTRSFTIAHLGCGGRGREHLQAIRRCQPRLRLVGICDQHQGSLSAAQQLLPEPVASFADAEDMLRTTRPDIFSFVTLPQTRLTLLDLAIHQGVRAISYEKPMALSLSDARAMVARASAAGVLTVVSHQHKYAAHWRAVQALIGSGALGEIREIQVSSKGWMLQYATHLIDYAMWLNGGHPPVAMTGFASGQENLTDSHPSPDYVLGRCRFANGVRGLIECGTLAADQDPSLVKDFWMNAGATVIGTAGVAQVLVGKGYRAVTAADGAIANLTVGFQGIEDTVPYYQELADCLEHPERRHACRGEVALLGHEAMMAMVVSAIERREVTVPLPPDLGYEPLHVLGHVLSGPSAALMPAPRAAGVAGASSSSAAGST